MTALDTVWLFLAGSAIGSFLNVCIYRIPRQVSLIRPGSACPHCNQPIKFYHNIPVVSYLLLYGRCAYCGEKISVSYFWIELISGLAPVFFLWYFNYDFYGIVVTIVFYGLLTLSIIDWETRIIPNSILMVLIGFGIMVNFWSPFVSWSEAGIGFITAGGILYVIAIVGTLVYKKESMGMGDVKLAAVLGFYLGWKYVLVVLYFGFFFAALYYLLFKLLGKMPINKNIPMGPFFSLSAVLWFLFGEKMLTQYINWISG